MRARRKISRKLETQFIIIAGRMVRHQEMMMLKYLVNSCIQFSVSTVRTIFIGSGSSEGSMLLSVFSNLQWNNLRQDYSHNVAIFKVQFLRFLSKIFL